MLTAFFENAYFLQSLGWAIMNSFWQVGLLWLVYQLIVGAKPNAPAVFKHNLAFTLLILSSIWFVSTILRSYQHIKHSAIAFFSLSVTPDILSTINAALPLLAVVYVLFLFFYLIKFSGIVFKTAKLKNNDLTKPDIDIRLFVNNTVLHLGIKKKVDVWISKNVDVPSVIGFFKPVILLPVAAITQLSTQQTEAILLHELAHIKRDDFLLNILQTVAKLMLFFNPFATLLCREIENERENCCDDWVLNYQYNRETYANALLQIEIHRQQKTLLALAATNGKKQLLNRIKRLFASEPYTFLNEIQKVKIITVVLIATFAIISLIPIKPLTNNAAIFTDSKKIYAAAKVHPITPKSTPFVHPTIAKTRKNVTLKNNATPKSVNIIDTKEEDFPIALINEDLFKNKPSNFSILPVSEKNELTTPKYFVRIEDQSSGEKNNNTYYFQLSKDSGKAAIKPIIFINQPVKNKAAAKKLPDTSSMPGKRVTT
ncbi:M56 family metallopeptidase [Ferruginibacter lapsinanis]|uniref:M56 family metallopeptidase n=1 Tax=Ferruginibacter lapsinanis TaxID=563172 RepID=UPI001E4761D9|nr:M56 family metallopeptidase [Ferruginibacter lapsinanis]UEG49588.1 M56 family metallopeptidase [Ferruginibacter lapsinanis]